MPDRVRGNPSLSSARRPKNARSRRARRALVGPAAARRSHRYAVSSTSSGARAMGIEAGVLNAVGDSATRFMDIAGPQGGGICTSPSLTAGLDLDEELELEYAVRGQISYVLAELLSWNVLATPLRVRPSPCFRFNSTCEFLSSRTDEHVRGHVAGCIATWSFSLTVALVPSSSRHERHVS